jgi:molybdopterin/thiamine biosynthesis adenylyltransferase
MINSGPSMIPSSEIHLVGCGGVGSYLLPLLLKMTYPSSAIHLWDGDFLEARNLDRQLFTEVFLGNNKANALCDLYADKRVVPHALYVTPRNFEPGFDALIFSAVDNHAARRVILDAVDKAEGSVILAANELLSSQSIFYTHYDKDTILDPRVRYPEILTDDSSDPLNPSCNEVQQENQQIALFNALAAVHAIHLAHLHLVTKPKLDLRIHKQLPRIHSTNVTMLRSIKEEELA